MHHFLFSSHFLANIFDLMIAVDEKSPEGSNAPHFMVVHPLVFEIFQPGSNPQHV